jgi:type III restriction enzyme
MLQEAIELQSNAVNRLVELTDKQNEITFKAPTGSGKTYMMADMMNRIIKTDKNVVFLVSSLSKGDLAKQNYEKFTEYSSFGSFKEIKPYLISSEISSEEALFIPTEYNVYLLPRDLYKKAAKLMQGPMEDFLLNMTLGKLFTGEDKKIYLIKDECHIKTTNLDSLSKNFFTKTYNFSATPKLSRGQTPDVEIKNQDAENAKLIKTIENEDGSNATVENAIDKFIKVKKEYLNLLGVNPCLIIQISNKDKADEELQEIYAILNKHADLKWMLIVNDSKECNTNDNFKAKKLPVEKWKNFAKNNASAIDIIIFKMVITEGWDIPRACMLYQVRDSKSKQLDEQVIGRVRRNPRLLDFETLSPEAQKLAMTAWIWGIIPDNIQKSFGVKLQENGENIINELKIKTTRLKTLSEKEELDINKFFNDNKNNKTNIVSLNIFRLYNNYKKAENSIQKMCDNYATDFQKWFSFTGNIDAIEKESNKYITNYEKSMEITKDEYGQGFEVSVPFTSYYTDNEHYINIKDWIWKRKDGNEKFSFDSEAEKQWTEILVDISKDDNSNGERVCKRISIGKRNKYAGTRNIFGEIESEHIGDIKQTYLWGKNYIGNSEIKFEYYLGALHSSYPDFIMKDSYDRIHIFEVKSVNISSNMPGAFDNNLYQAKLIELKKAYQQASKLTNQIFYLPILRDDEWTIHQYCDGNSATQTLTGFRDFLKADIRE